MEQCIKQKAKRMVAILFLWRMSVALYAINPYEFAVLSKPLIIDSLPAITPENLDFFAPALNRRAIKTNTPSNSVYLETPPVGNQGQLNSCTTWAMCYTGLGILEYARFGNWNIAKRSPSYLFNKYKTNDTCEIAQAIATQVAIAMKREGVCSWNLMPYDDTTCDSSAITDNQRKDAVLNRAASMRFDDLQLKSPAFYKSLLDRGLPIIVSQRVTASFDTMIIDGGIWTELDDTTMYRGYHATCIVGYDDNTEMFWVQNSWGVDSVSDGYYWVSYDLIEQGCFTHAYAITYIIPPIIKGSEKICTSKQYYIPQTPDDATISWSYEKIGAEASEQYPQLNITPINDTTVQVSVIRSQQTTNGTDTLPNGYNFLLKATVTRNGVSYAASKKVFVGDVVSPQIYVNPKLFKGYVQVKEVKNHTLKNSHMFWALSYTQQTSLDGTQTVNQSLGRGHTALFRWPAACKGTGKQCTVSVFNGSSCATTPQASTVITYAMFQTMQLKAAAGGVSVQVGAETDEGWQTYDGEYTLKLYNAEGKEVENVVSEDVLSTFIPLDDNATDFYSLKLLIDDEVIDIKQIRTMP